MPVVRYFAWVMAIARIETFHVSRVVMEGYWRLWFQFTPLNP